MAYTLITASYFTGDIIIPELVDLEESQSPMAQALASSGQQQIKQLVSKFQYTFIAKMFSEEFAKDFIEAASLEEPGELFIEVHRRLFSSIDNYLYSPIAYYVYYWYMRNTKTTTTAYGEVNIDFAFGRASNNNFKMLNAWNEMVELARPVYLWANSQRELFRQQGYIIKPSKSLITKLNQFGL